MSALLLGAVLTFAGCTEEEPEIIEEDSVISFGQTMLEIPPEGGEMTVAYFLENPVDGLEVVPGASEEWVHDFDMSEEGKVSFIVDSTDVEVEDREAVLSLKYGEDSVGLRLVQKGAEAQIMMDVEFARNFSFVVKVVPKDPEMRVYLSVVEQDVMDAFASEDEIFTSDRDALHQLAEHNNMTYEQYVSLMYNSYWHRNPPLSYMKLNSIQNLLDDGSHLKPATDYCVYGYGIDQEGNPLTQVYKIPVTTTALNADCNVTLDLDVKVNQQSATFLVTPSDDAQPYYNHFFKKRIDDEEEMRYEVQQVIDNAVFMGYSDPERVLNGGVEWEEMAKLLHKTGPTELTVNVGLAGLECTAYAYCLDDMGNIVSMGTVEHFTTEDVAMSDNVITMEVSDITFNSVKLSVSTTVSTDPYFVFLDKDDGGYEGLSSEDLINRIRLSKTKTTVFGGMGNFEKALESLDEESTYIIVAHGYQLGKFTTEAFVKRFTTEKRVIGDAQCELLIDKYFEVTDVCEKYPDEFAKYAVVPSGAMAPVRAEIEGDYEYYVYNYVVTSSSLSDTQLINMLISKHKFQGASGTAEIVGAFVYDNPVTFFAAAMDKNGNWGPVFRKEITFTQDGVSPIEELDLEGYVIK